MDGIYLINKPKNITSFDCIRVFQKFFPKIKVGHAGTLDPFATGLLIVLVGKATKLSKIFLNDNKSYEGKITFGYSTTTYDLTGEVTRSLNNFNLSLNNIKDSVKNFLGEIKQTPPIYSAIKKDGKKLYDYARNNEEIQIKARDVQIFNFDITDIEENKIKFKTKVSKGTYIRSLAHDIGLSIDIPSHLSKLKRTSSGIFNLIDAYELNQVDSTTKPSLTLHEYAKSLKKIEVKPYLEPLIKNGVLLDDRQAKLDEIFAVYSSNTLLAIYMPYKGKYKPLIIL